MLHVLRRAKIPADQERVSQWRPGLFEHKSCVKQITATVKTPLHPPDTHLFEISGSSLLLIYDSNNDIRLLEIRTDLMFYVDKLYLIIIF